MTKHFTYTEKQAGNTLTADEWNNLAQDVEGAVNAINSGSISGGSNGAVATEADPTDADKTIVKINDVLVGELTKKSTKGTNVAISGDNNINIEPRPALGDGEGKNTPGLANRKGGNISLKPGDDIELCSHKRGTSKNTEVAVKVIDGSDNPVKLQVFAGDITLTTKGKDKTKKKDATTGEDTTELLYDDPNVMNVNITTGEGKGYLKVRAQAIDLRCEDHGGIALQPKGQDGEGHMNKIKFEHGGGDGLEFATFNAEKTSIFTDEYRFNKHGVWKMATRTKEVSDKYDETDETTHYKYVKRADDFYDRIISTDPTCTTEDIIRTVSNAKYGVFGSTDSMFSVYTESGVLGAGDVSLRGVTTDELDSYRNLDVAGTLSDFSTELPQRLYEAIRDYTFNSSRRTFSVGVYGPDAGATPDLFITITKISGTTTILGDSGNLIVGNTSCDLSDIVTLVNYYKTNNLGPWANA